MRLFSENLLYTMSPVAVSLTCFTVSHVIIEPGITLRCQVRKPISHHIWGGRLNLMTSFVSGKRVSAVFWDSNMFTNTKLKIFNSFFTHNFREH